MDRCEHESEVWNRLSDSCLPLDSEIRDEPPSVTVFGAITVWPLAHLGFGYLCYTLSTRSREWTVPTDEATVILAAGTQIPDLVDKPLAILDVFPRGRSVGHSLLVAAVVLVVLFAWLSRVHPNRREYAIAFGVGYGSHLLGDALTAVAGDGIHKASFLLWPVVPLPDSDIDYSIGHYLEKIDLSPRLTPELLLVVVVLGIWVYDGMPGLRLVREVLARSLRRLRGST